MSLYRGAEALSWLKNNKSDCALAGNRFETTAEAIEAVKRLYAAGATEVSVGPPLEEPERIKKYGGPYADALDIVFPKEKTTQVMAVVRSLRADEGGKMKEIDKSTYRSEEKYRVMLWWD
jgi:hypothetical protein